jgi:signal transduction histidine kinase
VQERLETMKISGQRLCNLINDILDAASLNNSSLRLVDEDVPLSAVCEHVMHLTKAVLKKVTPRCMDGEAVTCRDLPWPAMTCHDLP